MAHLRNRRPAFSAIELLVVVAIIGILAALIAGAVVRVQASAMRGATETTLTKLASLLDLQWKAVIDSAKKEYDGLPISVKQNLVELANNPTTLTPQPQPRRDDRARLLYVKFRLKQEFPTSFAVAMNPGTVTVGSVTKDYLPRASVPNVGAVTGKPAYVSTIFPKLTLVPVELQSSVMLVLALQQARAGVSSVALDQAVGSNFVKVDAASGLSYLVDTWGHPLQFYAFPAYGYTGSNGVSTPDLDVVVTKQAGQTIADVLKLNSTDPQDPEGLLLAQAFYQTQGLPNSRWTPNINGTAFALEQAVHAQINPQVAAAQFKFRRLVPVIVSYGPDGDLGGDFAAVDPSMPLPQAGSYDNLYSFRLRQTGARGD